MVFSSLLFLFRFLPLVLILYFAAPRRLRNLVLLLVSLVFYAWGEPVYVILMIVSILISWTGGLMVDRFFASGPSKGGEGQPRGIGCGGTVPAGLFQVLGLCPSHGK